MQRKIFFLSFIFLLALGFPAACGKQDIPVTEPGIDGNVYLSEKSLAGSQDMPENMDHMMVSGNYLYFSLYENDCNVIKRAALYPGGADTEEVDFGSAETMLSCPVSFGFPEDISPEDGEEGLLKLFDLAVSGTQKNEWSMLQNPDRFYIRFALQDWTADPEGGLYFVLRGYGSSLNGPDEELGAVLCRRTAAGKWGYRLCLPELPREGIVRGMLALDGTGGVYVLTEKGILAVDEEGHPGKTAETYSYRSGMLSAQSLMGDGEGNVYYFIYENQDIEWKGFRVTGEKTPVLKEAAGLRGSNWISTVEVSGGKVYYTDESKGTLYEYDGSTSGTKAVLRWEDSELYYSNIRTVMILKEGKILVWYKGSGSGLCLLKKTPVSEIPEKTLVILASLEPSQSLEKAVAEFNRENSQYHVITENYGYDFYNSEDAHIRLDGAVVSSAAPDILDLHFLDFNKYGDPALLEDLTPYLERSGVLDKEDYLENLLEAYTVDGKLLFLTPSFHVSLIVGRASRTEKPDSWSMEDVYWLTEENPEQNRLLDDGTDYELNTYDYLLERFCSDYYLDRFIDWEKGTCSFDSPEFSRLLLWVGEHGTESPDRSGTATRFYEERLIPEEALLLEASVGTDFRYIGRWEVLLGEEIRLMGYPTADGRGSVRCSVSSPLGIVSSSEEKEGAWEFMEYYLSRQHDRYAEGLPARKSQLRKIADRACKREISDGREPGPLGHMVLGEESIPYYAPSEEQVDRLLCLIEEADFTPVSDAEKSIISIVTEEAENYYGGVRNLEDTAEIIQNRVGLLLQERK